MGKRVLDLKIIEAADRVVVVAEESGRRLMHEAAMEADMMDKFDRVEPRHVHPWRDPRGGVSQETAMEADMAKEQKIGGKLESVFYDYSKNELVITMRAPADAGMNDLTMDVVGTGQHVQLYLNPWIKKIQDARKGAPKVQFNSLTPEGTNLEKLKGEVEVMGLAAMKPNVEGQRGLAARVAMRAYSRLMREEDSEEAEVFWELANYFDKKMDGGTGS
ncbi:hypothetical protein LCGC14_0472080 [marine sediment metagenome]|uniref:Uncharacterized protein n=1 Tax=marine sediment metagenome TaxID=412755 RepID=A0A0F9UYU3_9ZZZZ